LSLFLVLSAAGGCGKKEPNGTASSVIVRGGSVEAVDTLYYLDLAKSTVEQPVDFSAATSRTPKFVQIEVARVTNPKKIAVSFEVWYEPQDKAKVFLGSFSLYPSDNPGKFIVPTHGRLSDHGVIRVSLVTMEETHARDIVKVALKKITFL
jgi:hypothetical protein